MSDIQTTEQPTPTPEPKPRPKTLSGQKTGKVTKISGDKTIRVDLDNMVKHPLYHKYIRRRTRLAVHDPGNDAALGDVVEVIPCRPISKSKSWRLVRVVRRAVQQ